MKVSARLALGFGLVLAMLAVIIGLAIVNLGTLNAGTREIVTDDYQKVRDAQTIRNTINNNARALRNALLAPDPATAQQELNRVMENRAALTEAMARLEKLTQDDRGKALLKSIKDAREPYAAVADEVSRLVQAGNREEAVALLFSKLRAAQNNYFQAVDAMSAYQGEEMDKAYAASESRYALARNSMLILGALALALGVAAAIVITRSLVRQLGGEPAYAAEIAGKIAAGDLSVAVDTRAGDKSSVLYAMKSMRDSLTNIVAEVRRGTDTIAAASTQISAGNQDLSSRTEEQASSLEETASSMEELTSTVKQNTDNARQANQLAVSASLVAEKGGEVVSQVVTTMGAINDSSKKIVDIIGVIDSIAFQTNILALNAAVEAARAGEQGRGFAVVASEVRTLAQRSANAAKEIKVLIDTSVEKVDAGSKLVDVAGATMNEVVESVKRVTDIMSEIMAASEEQSAGIDQINQAISQMDQATQQNAALVEQAAAAADAMQGQAANLAQTVSVFRLDGSQALAAAPVKTASQARAKPAQAVTLAAKAPVRRQLTIAEKTSGGDWEEF